MQYCGSFKYSPTAKQNTFGSTDYQGLHLSSSLIIYQGLLSLHFNSLSYCSKAK